MIFQSFNLIFLEILAIKFVEYSVLILAFFLFFILVNNLMDRLKKSKNIQIQLLSN